MDDDEGNEKAQRGDLSDSDDDDEGDDDDFGGKIRKGMSRLRKRGHDEILNEDDLELVREATGEGEAKKKAKVFDNASQLQSDLFGADEDSEEEKENDEIVGKKTTAPETGYESDEFADFIEDDLGDQKRLQRRGKQQENLDFNEVNDADMDEARDIFGDDFDIFARGEGYEDDEDEDEDIFGDDEDKTEEDKIEAVNRMHRRKEDRMMKQAARKRAYLRSAFEPSQLVEHFITEKDEKTREMDVPERLQDRLPDRGGLGDQELEEMSMFILGKCTNINVALRSLVAELNPGRILEFTPIQNNAVTASRGINMWTDEAHEALGDKVVELITKTIKLISYDKCEVPFIRTYCKDELAGYDATASIWEARKFDVEEVVEDLPDDTLFLLPAIQKKVER